MSAEVKPTGFAHRGSDFFAAAKDDRAALQVDVENHALVSERVYDPRSCRNFSFPGLTAWCRATLKDPASALYMAMTLLSVMTFLTVSSTSTYWDPKAPPKLSMSVATCLAHDGLYVSNRHVSSGAPQPLQHCAACAAVSRTI